MFRTLIIAAAVAALAAPAIAQDQTNEADVEGVIVSSDRVVQQDFEAISPVATLGSDGSEGEPPLGWREDTQQTANRTRTRGSRGASSVRVVRACELDLSLGDEDCAGK